MKKLLTLIVLIYAYSLQAQLVLTVAGQVDSIGNTNGQALLSTFNNPHGIALDCFGNIYVADRFGHQIRKITQSGIVTTLAGSGNSGDLDGQGTNAEFNEPWGLCADSVGNVYVADTRNNKIKKIDVAGNVTTIAGSGNFGTSDGPGLASTFGNPTGIEIDDNGIIYVADHLTHIIRKIDPTGFVSTIAGQPFVASFQDGVGNSAHFNRPYGLEIDNDNNIIVADEWNHRIRKVTPTGVVTTIAGGGIIGSQDGPGTGATFNYPWDVAVDSAGNMFVADGYNDVIRKIDVAGNVTTYVGTAGNSGATDGTGPAATFNGATSIAYLKTTDELYVGDAYNNLVRKIINLNVQTVSLQLTSGTSTTICQGESLDFKASPEIYNSYEFYIDNVLQQNSPSEFYTFEGVAPGNYFLSVIALDNGTQITSSDVFITVLPAPTPTITTVGVTSFFEGDSVTLIASAANDYLWSNGATTPTITVFNSGTYWVDVTNTNGCVGRSDSVIVDVTPFSDDPIITIIEGPVNISADGSEGILCFGTGALLRSDYNTGNQWLLDGFPISGATDIDYYATTSGLYQVQVQDSLGFILSSNEIRITVLPKQIDDFTGIPLNPQAGQTVQFNSTVSMDVTNFFWDFGDPDSGIDNFSNDEDPQHVYNTNGAYTVELITADIFGCSDTLIKTDYINVGDGNTGGGGNTGNPGTDPDGVFVPSAFSPNGDGMNDIFYVRGGNIASLEMNIYNQWGERIFFSDDQSFGWDGTYNGRLVQLATYTYVVQVETLTGEQVNLAGHVTVLR